MASLGSDHVKFLSLRKKLIQSSREKNLSIINADFLSFKVESKLSDFNLINGDTILLCQFFTSSAERDEENILAIYKNINNKFIDNVIIFTDGNFSLDKIPYEIKSHEKATIIPFEGKVSFFDLIDYFKKKFTTSDICLISNCDCYYDSSVELLKYLDFNNGSNVFSCTRKEINPQGNPSYANDPLIHLNTTSEIPHDIKNKNLDLSSSDCFILSGEILLLDDYKQVYLGSINTEYLFFSNQFLHRKKIINLFCFLNCIHLHKSRTTNSHTQSDILINKIFPNFYLNKTTINNYIYGTWRLRCPENYIDTDYPIQDFGDFLPLNSASLLQLKTNILHNLTEQKTLCMFYIFTKEEFNSGLLQKSFTSFFNLLPSLSYKVDVFLFSDIKVNEDELIKSLLSNIKHSEFINQIKYISLNIPLEDNVYIRSIDNREDYKVPKLGLSSGPNHMFFQSFSILKQTNYHNFILLEPDSVCLKSYWLDTLIDSCIKKDFLIQGGNYSGLNPNNYDAYYSKHINGLAIYKNHNSLHFLISASLDLIKDSVKSNFIITPDQKKQQINKHLSFDVALFLIFNQRKCLSKYMTSDLFSIKTDIEDYVVTKTEVLSKNPKAVILHQKKPNLKLLV